MGYPMVKTTSVCARFDTIPKCDGQTDGFAVAYTAALRRAITGSAVALHCINGDIQSQWEMANFDPLQNGNPFTDCQQK